MKNILIPTTLQEDTVAAVKTGLNSAAGQSCTITLMLVSNVSDHESASSFLRATRSVQTAFQTQVLEDCHAETANYPNCRLETHNRYGLTAPLLKNLLQHLNTDIIIVPASYQQERDTIHHYCLALLANSKVPMLYLTEDSGDQEFNKAMYLENTSAQLGLQELQQLVGNQFSFRIVSHASITEEHPEQLEMLLSEAISKNNIDLLIETRKTEKVRMKKRKETYVNETLGLPVLSIFEKA